MKNIDKILEPYCKIQNTVDSIQGFSKLGHTSQTFGQNFLLPLEELRKSFTKIEQFNKTIGSSEIPQISVNFSEFGRLIGENLKKTPESIMLLSKYGWYLDLHS